MEDSRLNPLTLSGQIYRRILELLEQRPEGVRRVELQRYVRKAAPTLHTKIINMSIGKLTEQFPDKVYRPERGLFRLKRYKP